MDEQPADCSCEQLDVCDEEAATKPGVGREGNRQVEEPCAGLCFHRMG